MTKKFTYEISVEATDKTEAETKMKGLRLLTSYTVEPNQQDKLTKEEKDLVFSFRQGGRTAKLIHLFLGEMLPNVFQKDKSETANENTSH